MTNEPGTRPPVTASGRAAAAVKLETKAELRAGVPGDAAWRIAEGGGRITLVNSRTGAVWVRDAAGLWRPGGRRTPLVERVAALLRQPDDQVDAIAALLRQDLRPWRELLDAGVEAALGGGADRSRVLSGRGRVAELMEATERRPHRIVLVVDDVEACAASWYADAETATDLAWAVYCRHQARRAEAASSGAYPVGVYDDRATAAVEAVKRRRWQRPGQTWHVEPVEDGAR